MILEVLDHNKRVIATTPDIDLTVTDGVIWGRLGEHGTFRLVADQADVTRTDRHLEAKAVEHLDDGGAEVLTVFGRVILTKEQRLSLVPKLVCPLGLCNPNEQTRRPKSDVQP